MPDAIAAKPLNNNNIPASATMPDMPMPGNPYAGAETESLSNLTNQIPKQKRRGRGAPHHLPRKPGPGRPPGLKNRITTDVREALQASFNGLGREWLDKLARKNPVAYANLLVRLMPAQNLLTVTGELRHFTPLVVRVEERDPMPGILPPPQDTPLVAALVASDAIDGQFTDTDVDPFD